MERVLFLDEYFLINFLMDIIVVHTVIKLFKIKAGIFTDILAAMSGSILSCIYVLFGGAGIIWQVLFHIITGFLMSATVCRSKIKKIPGVFLVMNICCAMLAGFMNYFYYSGIFVRIIYYITDSVICMFIVSAILSFILINVVSDKIIKLKNSYKPVLYKVTLVCGEKRIDVNALLDTGNTLTEPVSRKPVHIVEKRVMRKIVENTDIYKLNIRIIPFHSVGEEKGIMTGIIIDNMIVHNDSDMIYEKPVIGLYSGVLSEEESYEMLLNRSME